MAGERFFDELFEIFHAKELTTLCTVGLLKLPLDSRSAIKDGVLAFESATGELPTKEEIGYSDLNDLHKKYALEAVDELTRQRDREKHEVQEPAPVMHVGGYRDNARPLPTLRGPRLRPGPISSVVGLFICGGLSAFGHPIAALLVFAGFIAAWLAKPKRVQS